jgi:putative cardiolipin synthase
MHNKMFIADGTVAILGGRNIADEYFDLGSAFEFRDLDVAAVGQVAAGAGRLFDAFWDGPGAIPVTGLKPRPDIDAMLADGRSRLQEHRARMAESAYARAVRETDFVEQLQSKSIEWVYARGEVMGDAPGKTGQSDGAQWELSLAAQLRDAFYSAKREFLICSPYFVPSKKPTRRLCQQVLDGVDVRILTNSLAANDVPIAHANYAKYRRPLLKGGVELFELRRQGAPGENTARRGFGSTNASLHAKTFVIDRERVFIGSVNLDPRSVVINTEVGVLIDSPVLADDVAGSINTLMSPAWSYRLGLSPSGKLTWACADAQGQEITFETDPDTSWWKRFTTGLMGLLPLESQS